MILVPCDADIGPAYSKAGDCDYQDQSCQTILNFCSMRLRDIQWMHGKTSGTRSGQWTSFQMVALVAVLTHEAV